LEETLNTSYSDYTQKFTDESHMEERVGCAVVTPGKNKEIRLPRPFSIFNTEAKAINTAISITRNTIQPKNVIHSDSLSCLTALDGMKKIYNLKVVRMMNQIHQGNEKADQHAKAAPQGETIKNYNTVAEDWKNW
jgi:hypothetical protein